MEKIYGTNPTIHLQSRNTTNKASVFVSVPYLSFQNLFPNVHNAILSCFPKLLCPKSLGRTICYETFNASTMVHHDWTNFLANWIQNGNYL